MASVRGVRAPLVQVTPRRSLHTSYSRRSEGWYRGPLRIRPCRRTQMRSSRRLCITFSSPRAGNPTETEMSRHHSQPVSPYVQVTNALLIPPRVRRACSGLRTYRLDGANTTSRERIYGLPKAWHSCVVSGINTDTISRACYLPSGQPLRILLRGYTTRGTRLFVSTDAAESVCSHL